VAADADEYAGPGAREIARRDSRMLQRLPRHFQKHALLRICEPRLARRHREKPRIEEIRGIDEPAPARVHPAGLHRARRIPAGSFPTLLGDFAYPVYAVL